MFISHNIIDQFIEFSSKFVLKRANVTRNYSFRVSIDNIAILFLGEERILHVSFGLISHAGGFLILVVCDEKALQLIFMAIQHAGDTSKLTLKGKKVTIPTHFGYFSPYFPLAIPLNAHFQLTFNGNNPPFAVHSYSLFISLKCQ